MSNSSEDEENNNINEKREIDKLENSEFETVPIEDSQNNTIEIFNVYKGIDLSKIKFKRKLNQILLVILVIAIIFLMFKILNVSFLFNNEDNQDPVFNNENDGDNNQDNLDNDRDFDPNDDDEVNNIYEEYFYLEQKK